MTKRDNVFLVVLCVDCWPLFILLHNLWMDHVARVRYEYLINSLRSVLNNCVLHID